jgi:hypothetical protein
MPVLHCPRCHNALAVMDPLPPPPVRCPNCGRSLEGGEAWRRYPRGAWIVFALMALAITWGSAAVFAVYHYHAERRVDVPGLFVGFLAGVAISGLVVWRFKPWRRGWL